MSGLPTEGEQLAFLANVQRVLDDGQFTATYKFALLLSLVEIAIERGADTGAPLPVRIDSIAEKFIELYWGHTAPFQGIRLSQNRGRLVGPAGGDGTPMASGGNIAILRHIERLQDRTMSLPKARRLEQWNTTVRQVARLVREMPLFRLQLLRGNDRVRFLYEEEETDGAVTLKPGVAYCLRKFSPLLWTLSRESWLREIRNNPRNARAVGQTSSLEAFLFGDERVPLAHVGEVLLPLQDRRCFYCHRELGVVHVDHFVPWSLYASNLGHNLVLTDTTCNQDKADLLADVPLLERWQQRNAAVGPTIAEALEAKGIVSDLNASLGIARWAYERARSSNSIVWTGRGSTRRLAPNALLPL